MAVSSFFVRAGDDIRDARGPLLSALEKRSCAVDLAKRPRRDREIGQSGHAAVHSETKGEVVVAAGLEQRQRLRQVTLSLRILPREPMR